MNNIDFFCLTTKNECFQHHLAFVVNCLLYALEDFLSIYNAMSLSVISKDRSSANINGANPSNRSKNCLLFSSAEMFKKSPWQTVWTQIRLLL